MIINYNISSATTNSKKILKYQTKIRFIQSIRVIRTSPHRCTLRMGCALVHSGKREYHAVVPVFSPSISFLGHNGVGQFSGFVRHPFVEISPVSGGSFGLHALQCLPPRRTGVGNCTI